MLRLPTACKLPGSAFEAALAECWRVPGLWRGGPASLAGGGLWLVLLLAGEAG